MGIKHIFLPRNSNALNTAKYLVKHHQDSKCSISADDGEVASTEFGKKTVASGFWNYELGLELREQEWESHAFMLCGWYS